MKKSLFQLKTLVIVLPVVISISTAAYLTVALNKQNAVIDDLIIVADKSRPIVTSRSDLENQFDRYIRKVGLKLSPDNASRPGVRTGQKNSTDYAPSTDDERIYGNPDAQFYLIEYSDFECSYCKEHFPQLLDLVDSSSGNIALVFKHVPVTSQASQVAAIATECAAEQAGNPGFFKMARAVFSNTQADGRGLTIPLDTLAKQNGLDDKRLIECINSVRPAGKIAADLHEAVGLNIQKTPTTIVVHGEKSAIVQGMVNGTGLMQMMAQLASEG